MRYAREPAVAVGERMARVDQLDQPPAIDVRIDLRRREIGMAEHHLDRAEIRLEVVECGV